MYCQNCGKEINENAAVCLNCGVAVNNVTQKKSTNSKKGKGIASMVLGIISVFYSLVAFASLGEAQEALYFASASYKFGFAIGFVLIQSTLAIVGICLAISERKNNKNGFNTSGFWLAISSFICIAIQFIIVLTY